MAKKFVICTVICLVACSARVWAGTTTLRQAVSSGALSVEIEGTGTDACYGPCMAVRIVNHHQEAYTVVCERGTVLVARDRDHQTMVVSRETALSVAARSETVELLFVFCLDMDKLPPQTCRYDVARTQVSEDVLKALDELGRRGLSASQCGQYVIWFTNEDQRRPEVVAALIGDPAEQEESADMAQEVIRETFGEVDAERFARPVLLPVPALFGLNRDQVMWAMGAGAALLLLLIMLAARRPRRASQGGAAAPPLPPTRRPGGVTLLGVLYLLGGIGGGLATLAGAVIFFGAITVEAELAAIVLATGSVGLALGGAGALMGLLIGVGLLRLRNWARVLVVVFATIGVIACGFGTVMLVNTKVFPTQPLITGAISLLIVMYLCSKKVKAAFA